MSTQVQAAGSTAPAASAPSAAAQTTSTSQHPMASLYVGDLHASVTESMLYNKFASAGPVLSIRVCRDAITRRSLGYAYVNFQLPADAERAIDTMNFDLLNNKPMRIMWSQRDPTVRRSGSGNIFIKNLDPHIDTKSIYDTFSMFGNILSCKIASDEEGKSKGYGFIHFETDEAAQKAIDKVNGMLLDNKTVFVAKFQPRSVRLREMGDAAHRYTNVYVKNFSDKLDDKTLHSLFEKFGPILSHVVMKDADGKSRGFGFVSFEKHEDAEKAVNEMDGYTLPETDLKLTVCRAQKKAERLAELAARYEKVKAERLQKYAGTNVYVKFLDESVDDAELRRVFEACGKVNSAKVMTDESGRSKGFGFVCYDKPEYASKALAEMNTFLLKNKPLFVALAQRKEERKSFLAAQHMQKAAALRTQGAPGMSVYAPANPNLFAQRGNPYVQNALPGPMRNMGYGAMPGYMFPQNQYMAQRSMGGPRPQQYANRPQSRTGIRQTGTRQQQKPSQGTHSNIYPVVQQGRQGNQMSDLTPRLSSATGTEQKQILGEILFPRIAFLAPEESVGKLTGMLLEMDTSELLRLLENPDALKTQVAEAARALALQAAKA